MICATYNYIALPRCIIGDAKAKNKVNIEWKYRDGNKSQFNKVIHTVVELSMLLK